MGRWNQLNKSGRWQNYTTLVDRLMFFLHHAVAVVDLLSESDSLRGNGEEAGVGARGSMRLDPGRARSKEKERARKRRQCYDLCGVENHPSRGRRRECINVGHRGPAWATGPAKVVRISWEEVWVSETRESEVTYLPS